MHRRSIYLLSCMVALLFVTVAQAQAMGFSCSAQSERLTLSAYAGGLYHPNGMTLTTRFFTLDEQYVDENALQGAWFEIALRHAVTDNLGFIVSGGVLAPLKTTGTETETIGGVESEYALSGTTWGMAQGLIRYGVSDMFSVIGGFRWDHFNTRFDFDDSLAFLDYKLNTYIPLIGVLLDRRFYGGEWITGVMGWPGAISGHMKQSYVGGPVIQAWTDIRQDVTGGHFVEIFSEYRMNLYDGVSAGVFSRWNILHVTTGDDTFDYIAGGGSNTDTVHETFDRRSWAVGCSITCDFALPALYEDLF